MSIGAKELDEFFTSKPGITTRSYDLGYNMALQGHSRKGDLFICLRHMLAGKVLSLFLSGFSAGEKVTLRGTRVPGVRVPGVRIP